MLTMASQGGTHIMGPEQDIGSIEVGEVADLVVLNVNPLDDTKGTTNIALVVKGGVLFEAHTLDEICRAAHPYDKPPWAGEEPYARQFCRCRNAASPMTSSAPSAVSIVQPRRLARKSGAGRRCWAVALGALFAAELLTVHCEADSKPASRAHEVRLIRDAYGMAHLYAAREEDGFYGLGYAEGEDPLQQILTWYVALRGELAATFGPKTPPLPTRKQPMPPSDDLRLSDAVETDLNVRKYRILETARKNFPRLPAQYQRDVRAFIAGLGAYMREHPDKTPSWAPPLEPALPVGILDLFILEAHGVCAARHRADLAASGASAALSPTAAPAGPLASSNAWAVAGSRSADSGVFFSADSHGEIQVYGMVFYPYRIRAGDLDFMAFEPTGSANFLFGHSPYFGWGITEGPRFVGDCYRVKVDHTRPQRFLYDGKWRTMTVKPYTITVKNSEPVKGILEYTHHNGVLSPVEKRVGDTAYVVSYASADRLGLESGEYYRLAKARSRKELESVLAQRDAYPANMVIGGADGTIMYIRPGRIPIRAPGVDAHRTIDGNISATAWRGVHRYANLLKLINPPQGWVGNSNISPDMMYRDSPLRAGDYPSYFGFEPGFITARQRRLIELFDSTAPLSVGDILAIAMDETIPGMRPWGAAIAQAVHEQADFVRQRPLELRPFLDALEHFDGTLSKDSRGALDHFELRRALLEKHRDFMDALGEAIDKGPALASDMQQLLITAAEEARERLIATYGRADLTWGDVHRVGRGGVDYPEGGGIMLMGVKRGGWANYTSLLDVPKPAVADATLRGLAFTVDPQTKLLHLDDGQRAPFVVHFTRAGVQTYAETLWGVSEDPDSPHFSDQARLSSEKQLRPIPLTLPALEREQTKVTVLTVPPGSP
jgi:acyl-homoserine lactone acylase PvdQ